MKNGVVAPSALDEFLKDLGFSSEERGIFIALTQLGTTTILELSRHTNISRTQIYRLVEELQKKGLVEEIIDEYRTLVKAINIDQLEFLVTEQQKKAEHLKKIFPQVQELILANVGQNQADTRIQFYRGERGIKQMGWNLLRAKNEILGYTYRKYQDIVGPDFYEQLFTELALKKIQFRDIYSDQYVQSVGNMHEQIKKQYQLPPLFHSLNHSRYIPSNKLDIEYQTDIYNDVVAYYNWYEGEIFGVEIYNAKIARFHRQVFELIWQQSWSEEKLLASSRRKPGSSSQKVVLNTHDL